MCPVPGYVSFFRFGKFLSIIYSNTFLLPFSLSSPSGTPIMSMLGCFVFSHKSYMLLSFFYMSFCCSDWVISIILSSRSLMHSSVSFSLLFFASRVLFISEIELPILGGRLYCF